MSNVVLIPEINQIDSLRLTEKDLTKMKKNLGIHVDRLSSACVLAQQPKINNQGNYTFATHVVFLFVQNHHLRCMMHGPYMKD